MIKQRCDRKMCAMKRKTGGWCSIPDFAPPLIGKECSAFVLVTYVEDQKKLCSLCGEEKLLTEFSPTKWGKYKRRCYCNKCLSTSRPSRSGNQKDILRSRAYKDRNREMVRAKDLAYKKAHPEIGRNQSRMKRLTPCGSLNHRMSLGMYIALRGGGGKSGRKWELIAGYTVDELLKHIEKRFTAGMSWEVFLTGKIHIDHIIPQSAFNYETAEDPDFKRCWSLKNLRPMWAKDNMSKSDKLAQPFQPSLLLRREA